MSRFEMWEKSMLQQAWFLQKQQLAIFVLLLPAPDSALRPQKQQEPLQLEFSS